MIDTLFGAPPIPLDQLWRVNEGAPNLILWAVPVMILLTAVELVISFIQEKPYYEKWETVGSILVGLGSVAIGVAIKLFLLYGVV